MPNQFESTKSGESSVVSLQDAARRLFKCRNEHYFFWIGDEIFFGHNPAPELASKWPQPTRNLSLVESWTVSKIELAPGVTNPSKAEDFIVTLTNTKKPNKTKDRQLSAKTIINKLAWDYAVVARKH